MKEQIDILKQYGSHLPTCNINQDWTEAYQAMADTPYQFRDENYHIALEEINSKRYKCTCGYSEALHSTGKEKGLKWVKVEDGLPKLSPSYYEDESLVTPVVEKCIVYDGESVFEKSFTEKGFKFKDDTITHWMYFPKPPGDESIEGEDREVVCDMGFQTELRTGEQQLKIALALHSNQKATIERMAASLQEKATELINLDCWRKRCEAAERFIKESPGDPDIYPEQIKAYNEWQELVIALSGINETKEK